MHKMTEKMRKIFCKKNTIVAACAVAVIAVSGSIAYAATANGYDPVTAKQNGGWTSTVTGTQYNSYGKINYTNGSNSVVVDAADIAAIDNMVGEGKTQIKNAIHAVDADDRLGTSAWTETTFPDFGNLASLISGSQTLTEAQTGTQALNNNGEALYYKDQAASEARDLTQTCTDDTGYPVYYQSATAANLTAGSAAYIDGKLILGTGADNDAYLDLGGYFTEECTVTKIASPSGANSDVTYKFKDDYDFLIVSCYSRANSDGTSIKLNSANGKMVTISKMNGHPDEDQQTIHRYITAFLFNISADDKITFVKNGGYRFNLNATICAVN